MTTANLPLDRDGSGDLAADVLAVHGGTQRQDFLAQAHTIGPTARDAKSRDGPDRRPARDADPALRVVEGVSGPTYHWTMGNLAAGRIHIVLAPGFMLDRELWADAEQGLQAIGSLTYADLSRDGSIEAMADRLLNDAPERFVLIGFSMGGYVAREAARRAPGRVQALVLIATSSRGDSDIEAQRKATAARSLTASKFTGLSRRSIAASLADDHADDATIVRIRAMGDRLGGEVFQRQSSLVRNSDRDCLAGIICPTLVIAADEDRLRTLAEARELHEGIRQSTMVTIAGSGHMIPLEAPESMVDAIAAWLCSLTWNGGARRSLDNGKAGVGQGFPDSSGR